MYDFLPYYAGVYAYEDISLHPNFPRNDPEFMSMWDKVNLTVWEAKMGEKPDNEALRSAVGPIPVEKR